jgi:hypothetical protein
VLFAGSIDAVDAVLRGMRLVATGDGRHQLSDAARGALVHAHVIVFGGHGELDADALPAVSPAELAAAVAPRERERVAEILAVMAVVDGVVDPARIETSQVCAAALGVDAPFLRDLRSIEVGDLAAARADIVARNIRSFTGRWLGDDIDAWLMPYQAEPDEALHARYEGLGACAPGTFGHEFHQFYMDNGFDYPGRADSANEAFTTPHDSAHVLSGYDTSLQGELLVSTFTAGMHPDDAMTAHVLPVILSWHLGIELAEFAGSATGKLDPRKFWIAWDRGDRTEADTLDHAWDFWSHVDDPLDEVRQAMGVPALAPDDAADGHYPDWYTPTA